MSEETQRKRKRIPARTPEARENELINLAVNLAEERLRNGSASSQIIVTLLNLATTRARLENEKLKSDLDVAHAKIEQMRAQETSKEVYEKALEAFRSYQGTPQEDYADDYD